MPGGIPSAPAQRYPLQLLLCSYSTFVDIELPILLFRFSLPRWMLRLGCPRQTAPLPPWPTHDTGHCMPGPATVDLGSWIGVSDIASHGSLLCDTCCWFMLATLDSSYGYYRFQPQSSGSCDSFVFVAAAHNSTKPTPLPLFGGNFACFVLLCFYARAYSYPFLPLPVSFTRRTGANQ